MNILQGGKLTGLLTQFFTLTNKNPFLVIGDNMFLLWNLWKLILELVIAKAIFS